MQILQKGLAQLVSSAGRTAADASMAYYKLATGVPVGLSDFIGVT
jgi:hypothetical protein